MAFARLGRSVSCVYATFHPSDFLIPMTPSMLPKCERMQNSCPRLISIPQSLAHRLPRRSASNSYVKLPSAGK